MGGKIARNISRVGNISNFEGSHMGDIAWVGNFSFQIFPKLEILAEKFPMWEPPYQKNCLCHFFLPFSTFFSDLYWIV